jgi:hypothetical protein
MIPDSVDNYSTDIERHIVWVILHKLLSVFLVHTIDTD